MRETAKEHARARAFPAEGRVGAKALGRNKVGKFQEQLIGVV